MKGKTALIIGGGTGIGRETALLLAKNGAQAVIVAGRRLEKLQEVADEIGALGVEAMTVQTDVTKPESVDGCLSAVADRYGCMVVLVNSGGICLNTPFNHITPVEWDRVMQTNLWGTFYFTQKAIDLMVARGVKGSIVNVTSIAAKMGAGAVGAHYAASKAGISNVTISAARYAARFGIRVNAVAPGPIGTDMTADWDKDMSAKLVKTIPFRSFGRTEDVAEMIAFLASAKAGYITGEIIDINGGAFMD